LPSPARAWKASALAVNTRNNIIWLYARRSLGAGHRRTTPTP
jgi:hypothetical protein